LNLLNGASESGKDSDAGGSDHDLDIKA